MAYRVRELPWGIILLVFLLGCSGGQVNETQQSSTLHVVLNGEPGNIDPHYTTEIASAIILRQLYDTLVYLDPQQKKIVPGLATEWAISTDNLVYTFTLRKDVRFQDGTVFNSKSVAKNLDRISTLGSEVAKASIYLSNYYLGYEVVDDYTIKLKLSQPYAPFLDGLTQPYLGIASPRAIDLYSASRYQFYQIGTGPFILANYVPGKQIDLRRNPDYKWGPSFYSEISANSPNEIQFTFVENVKKQLSIAATIGATLVTDMLSDDAQALTGNTNVRIIPVRLMGQPLQFMLNTRRFPTDNPIFRQALLYGANRNLILDTVFQRFYSIGWTPLTSNSIYYVNQLEGIYASDIGKAQSLLASIGYSDSDNNKYIDLGGIEASVTLLMQSGDSFSRIAKILSEQWQQIGVKTKIVVVPTATALRAKAENGEYNLVAKSTIGTDPSILNEFFVPAAKYSWSNYEDTSLTSLLVQGITSSDPQTRLTAYTQAQQQIMEQALVLPIGEPIRLDVVNTEVLILSYDTLGIPILNNVTIAN